MVPPLENPGEGGIIPKDVGAIICRGHAGDTDIKVGDLGGVPLHGAEPGGVPTPSGAVNHGLMGAGSTP